MKGGLIVAALAAFAYYKYSKMSEEQKRNLVNALKQQGQRFCKQNIPDNVKTLFPA